MAQSEADLTSYCQRKIGAGVVGVELTTDQIDEAIDDSKRVFQEFIGQTKTHEVTGINAGGNFDMPADCEQVVEVSFALNQAGLYDQFNWAGVELGPLSFGIYGGYRIDGSGVGGGYSYLVQALQYREMAKTILGIDRDWYWDYAQRKLVITPTEGQVGTSAFTRYLVSEVDVSLLRSPDYGLMRKYCYAECLETLGMIRTKYSELPSATGTISMNGDTLFANADVLKAEVINRLKLTRQPPGFFAA